jgi:hypothetical protein
MIVESGTYTLMAKILAFFTMERMKMKATVHHCLPKTRRRKVTAKKKHLPLRLMRPCIPRIHGGGHPNVI